MKNILTILLLSMVVGSCQFKPGSSNENEDLTAEYFESIREENDGAQLTLFLSQMPKGGDIHHHYSGAIYAETFLDWAASRNATINSLTFRLDTMGYLKEPFITVDSLRKNNTLYRALLQSWSDMDYSNHFQIQEQPDVHFFNTFSYFATISTLDYRNGLNGLKARAKKENVQYIETMITSSPFKRSFSPDTVDLMAYYQRNKDEERLSTLLEGLSAEVVQTPGYVQKITAFTHRIHQNHEGIDDADFTMRYQVYATRNDRIDEVFSKLYSCFDIVSRDKSSLLVGVNFVGPENGLVATRDYWLHMQVFKFLKKKFPDVRLALHAGELTLGMVTPETLSHHINDAVLVAGANRIGHGVDIAYETNAMDLLTKMKEKKVAVELNLTSNEFILGVKNEDHPVRLYVKSGVPVVLSTDDAGVSRNNLTSEFVKLVSRYHFNYLKVKEIIYNSIDYSFADGTKKQQIKSLLDSKFVQFESKIASQFSQKNN